MNIFVGSLSFDATQDDVKKLFEGFGNVASVVILMRKEKKAPKSRGFGFVEMPDEQQALAAMAALNGKEFMGRVLNVNPARPKGQKAMVWPPLAKAIAKAKTEAGRESELKKKRQPKPWQKSSGEHKPWKKTEGRVRPWKKSTGESKPWKKSGGESRPWKKSEGESKPWRKSEDGFKPWKKTEGESRPWKKSTGESKPWKKPVGEAKPWSKSSERPQESRFKGRRKPGGYKRRS